MIEKCPCCGGPGKLKDSKVQTHGGGSFRRGWVGCPECELYIQWTHDPWGAVKKWNNRAVTESEETTRLRYELRLCRDELCLQCGDYKLAHKGACDGCRWKEVE